MIEERTSNLPEDCYFVEKHLWSGDSRRREVGSYPFHILNSTSRAPSVLDSY